MTRSLLRPALLLAAALTLAACASTSGPAVDDFDRARRAYLAQDYPRAYTLMQRLAEAGDPRAQYTLGYMYYNGLGIDQDLDQALTWIRRSAAQGDKRAIEALGVLASDRVRRPGAEPAPAPTGDTGTAQPATNPGAAPEPAPLPSE